MVENRKIVAIDDEEDIRELLSYNLEREGFKIILRADGQSGLKAIREFSPDLIILDLMLPILDGLDLCRIVKNDKDFRNIPILMLSAKGEEEDVVIGLELGADDYVTKPFSMNILTARIKALLRRGKRQENEDMLKPIIIDELKIDPQFYMVTINDNEVKMTPMEFMILKILAQNRGNVLTRSQLLNNIQGDSIFVTDRTIDVHLASIRKKLGSLGSLIETVRGVGYRLISKNEI